MYSIQKATDRSSSWICALKRLCLAADDYQAMIWMLAGNLASFAGSLTITLTSALSWSVHHQGQSPDILKPPQDFSPKRQFALISLVEHSANYPNASMRLPVSPLNQRLNQCGTLVWPIGGFLSICRYQSLSAACLVVISICSSPSVDVVGFDVF